MDARAGCLVLENGAVFQGMRIGAQKNIIAEAVFTTGMNGYLETLTDPSYFGQAVVQTFPLIGNYGVIQADFEAKQPFLSAYLVSELCGEPSNFRCGGRLGDWLAANGIPGLCGIDTRRLTRILRENGTMNAMLCDSPEQADPDALSAYRVADAVAHTTCQSAYTLGDADAEYHVALLDLGAKANIARSLVKRGCRVTVLPAFTPAAEIAALHPDGIMLSNGPGDPAENTAIIAELKALTAYNIPIMAICLGHQLLALANGMQTAKLKFGHRGVNQPVRDLTTGHLAMTSQNHGYQVLYTETDAVLQRFVNVNDGTCEGLQYRDFPGLSVQFHPEACAGPQDTEWLFDEFLQMMEVPSCR